MAKLNVNIGQSVNDKTGDTLRSAFDKINQNFTELYTLTGGSALNLQELAQDYAAPMFNHASHVNITATYDDANNKILLTGVVAAQVQSDWNASSGLGVILNKPTLFSGSYTDLTNKPSIPSAYTLPTASSSVLGGIKIGTGLSIDVNGVVTASSGSVSSLVNGAKTVSLGTDSILTLPAPLAQLINASQLATDTAKIYRATNSTDLAAIATAWETWYESEQMFRELVYQDSVTNPNRPWANKPSWEAYPIITAYVPTGSQLPIPSNLPPTAKEAHDNYLAYKQLVSSIDIVNGNKTISFNNAGLLSLPGKLEFKDTANAKIILKTIDQFGYVVEASELDKTWTFNANGSLTFPNNTTQTTAWTGSVSSLVNGANTVSLDNGGLDLTFTSGEKIKTVFGGGIELYRSGDNTIGIYTSGAEIKTFATGGAKHTWTFGTNGSFKIPNNSELRPSTTAYDTALAGWEFIRGGEITDRITNNLATALGWPMVNWYPTGATAQGYIDFLLNAKTLQDTAGATLIIQPALSTIFYNEMRAALIAIRDSYNTSTTAVSLSSAYGKSWNFGTNGNTTFPTGLVLGAPRGVNTVNFTSAIDKEFQIETGNSSTSKLWRFGTDGNTTLPTGLTFRKNGTPYSTITADLDKVLQIETQTSGGVKQWSFGTTGALTFPNGTLKITDSVISNLNVVGSLSTGSQIQVGNGTAANTGIIISNGTGDDSTSSRSLINVNGNNASMMLQVANSLGGEATLTGQQLVEVGSGSVVIGLRVINAGAGAPVTTFSGWTFNSQSRSLTLPEGAVINETASSPGLTRTKYSGTFVLDPTWFVTNAGNLIETTTINDTIIMHDYITGAFSFQYFGYFVPPTSANYTFRAHADETFIFWIGAKALSGYTYANKDMYGNYNGTFPEQQTQSFTIALTAGQFYPIRIQWANSGGVGELDVFTWANDVGQANTANFTGRIYTANTGTAKIAVNDNKSIILSTDNATDNNWTFAPNGSLTLPIGVSIDSSVGPLYPKIIADSGKLFSVQGQGSTGSAALAWTVDPNAASQYAAVAVNRAGGDNLAKVVLQAQSDSGNVATVKLWKFDETGKLSLPAGGTITEGGGLTGAIKLTPAGGANAYQALLIYPTAGGDGDHVHLTAGGGTTELYLGNDNHYVKLVNGGNVEVRAYQPTSPYATAVWGFGTDGAVSATKPLIINVPNGVPSSVGAIGATTGSWELNPRSNLATTGGSGSGLTVNVTETGGYASAIAIATAGTGYLDGELITVTSGSSSASFIIAVTGNRSWTFGTDGKLTAPGNLQVNGGKIILNTGGNAYVESVDYGVNSANSALNIFGGPYQKINLRAGFGTQATWQFGTNGGLTLPASGDVVDSTSVSQLARRVEGSWTVTNGTSTYSFTVPMDGTYTMWVKGNIPNGIITWNATLSISNTNVPAIGTQYAWNYTGGGSPILLTAIPDQIRGSAGTISTDNTYAGTTSNRFDFGISNTSGANQTIYYGYIRI